MHVLLLSLAVSANSDDTCSVSPKLPQLQRRSWTQTPNPWDEFAAQDPATPFVLTGSPVSSWAALRKWTPEFLSTALADGGIPNVRRSTNPRFLYYVIDQHSAELARNAEFWRLVDRGGEKARRLGASAAAHQIFRWSAPHRMQGNMPAARFARGLRRISANDERSVFHTYSQMSLADPLSTPALRALLDDVQPLGTLAARREGHPTQLVANLWAGSVGATATPHYDAYDNVHVQVHGTKRWKLAPPKHLLTQQIFPMGHPSARQLQDPDAELLEADGALEVVLRPGDVLCLPAYWLHEVVAEGNGSASLSFNSWKPSQAQRALFRHPELFFADAIASEAVLSAVLRAVLGGALDQAEGKTAEGADGQEDVVRSFFRTQLALRWAPLGLNFSTASAHPCSSATAFNAVPKPMQAAVHKLVRIFDGSAGIRIPKGALPTILMDWSEAVCYDHASVLNSETGMRACPFYFHSCFAE
tara:strand:+ start:34 stop:1455 length:1422 start_codon:yes stop_codon:yes gene_type:complete